MATPTIVDVDSFCRAETDRMFHDLQAAGPGINRLHHARQPTPIDQQTVIRMNRDTLYSFAIVDLSEGATVTIPDTGDRYVSVMVVNNDHYINGIFHEPGLHELTIDQFDTRYVLVAARILVDAADPDDAAEVNALQDQLAVAAGAAVPFEMPAYDAASFDGTRQAVLELAKHAGSFDGAFGRRDEVDALRRLIGTAAGWGGLPTSEAVYHAVGGLPFVPHQLTVRDVPVDAFWSISLYDEAGFFKANELGRYSVNDITGESNADGSMTVTFGGDPDAPNQLPIMEGWNYLVRMYRPRSEVLDGSWTFPAPGPI